MGVRRAAFLAASYCALLALTLPYDVTALAERRELIVGGDVATPEQANYLVQLFDISAMVGDIAAALLPEGGATRADAREVKARLEALSPDDLRVLLSDAFENFGYTPSCGGSLVAPNVVLTAAHCVAMADPRRQEAMLSGTGDDASLSCDGDDAGGLFIVRAGARTSSSSSGEGEYRFVTSSVCHPNFTTFAPAPDSPLAREARAAAEQQAAAIEQYYSLYGGEDDGAPGGGPTSVLNLLLGGGGGGGSSSGKGSGLASASASDSSDSSSASSISASIADALQRQLGSMIPVNDVALLRLDAPFERAGEVVQLASPREYEAAENDARVQAMYILGAGKQSQYASDVSAATLWSAIPLWDEAECEEFTSLSVGLTADTYAGEQRIFDVMVCAGGTGQFSDACQGDSGSPAFIEVRTGGGNSSGGGDGKDEQAMGRKGGSSSSSSSKGKQQDDEEEEEQVVIKQAGVVSWGIGCSSSAPGFYSRVAEYRDWIAETVDEWSDDVDDDEADGSGDGDKAGEEDSKSSSSSSSKDDKDSKGGAGAEPKQ